MKDDDCARAGTDIMLLRMRAALAGNRDAFGGVKIIDVHAWLSVAAGLFQLRSRPGRNIDV